LNSNGKIHVLDKAGNAGKAGELDGSGRIAVELDPGFLTTSMRIRDGGAARAGLALCTAQRRVNIHSLSD
jgi:hypothetical protein